MRHDFFAWDSRFPKFPRRCAPAGSSAGRPETQSQFVDIHESAGMAGESLQIEERDANRR